MFHNLSDIIDHKKHYCKLRFTCKCAPKISGSENDGRDSGMIIRGFNQIEPTILPRAVGTGGVDPPPHCRFLVPGNSTKVLQDVWHQFWHKNDGEKWCHWNYFQIPRSLSPATNSVKKNFIGTIIFVLKLVSNVLKNFCAIPWHQKPTLKGHHKNKHKIHM